MDGLCEFPGAPGAAAELAEYSPCFELRVRAFAGGAEFRVGAVGFFLRVGLVPAPVRDLRPGAAPVSLVGEGDQAGFSSSSSTPQTHSAFLSCTEPGSAPETHRMSPCGLAMTCRFIPCFLCLPE